MSNNHPRRCRGVALAIGLLLALPVAAKTYCCTDKNGHRICGDALPEQCSDRAYKEISNGGVAQRVDAPLTAEQKSKREAEEVRKKEEERVAGEQRRKDQALLNTYGSEKDIDFLRDRAVADQEVASKQAKDKYDAAVKRKQQLDRELEFYAKKPVPESLKAQIKENTVESEAQKKALDDKKKDIEVTRAKFEEDRRRYRELTGTDPRPR